jgi:hypothetical protein
MTHLHGALALPLLAALLAALVHVTERHALMPAGKCNCSMLR